MLQLRIASHPLNAPVEPHSMEFLPSWSKPGDTGPVAAIGEGFTGFTVSCFHLVLGAFKASLIWLKLSCQSEIDQLQNALLDGFLPKSFCIEVTGHSDRISERSHSEALLCGKNEVFGLQITVSVLTPQK